VRGKRTASSAPRRHSLKNAVSGNRLEWAIFGICPLSELVKDPGKKPDAVAESFFATLKTEIGTQAQATRDDARRAVFAYLGCYNHDRLHSTLGYRTPHETRIKLPSKYRPRSIKPRCPAPGGTSPSWCR
jgi:hypothetical protein